ncbi:MAG: Holliday junction resolvase RuvX [Thermodesulfobacteriota bacterium]
MRVLGLDLGKKRIGVAISDESGSIAMPLMAVERSGIENTITEISRIVEEYSCKTIVVGIPYNMDGSTGRAASAVFTFIEKLKEKIPNIEITGWDERLSTAAVEKVLIEGNVRRDKRKGIIDKLAASYILQGWLERQQGQ